MNWVRHTQINKLGVLTSLPNLLPKFFGLSLPILVCSVHCAWLHEEIALHNIMKNKTTRLGYEQE